MCKTMAKYIFICQSFELHVSHIQTINNFLFAIDEIALFDKALVVALACENFAMCLQMSWLYRKIIRSI